MIPRIAALICAMFLCLAPAAAQRQYWLHQFGTNKPDMAYALAPGGASGGVFVAGITDGSLGGPNAGGYDAWLAHYSAAGNQTLIRQFGTSAYDWALALAPDSAGGVFVAGCTYGSLSGPSKGNMDAWLARYDSAGNRAWIRQFGTVGYESARALAPDGAGGVFVAGETTESFGGPNPNPSVFDVWLARYDAAGQQTWIRQFGTGAQEYTYALTADGAGGVFIAGDTEGSLGGPSAGDIDAWLAHYDSTGSQTWIRQFGTASEDRAYALASDGTGGAFLAGHSYGSLGGPNAGLEDAWLARCDSAGNQMWIRPFATNTSDLAWALTPDSAGGVYIAGYTDGSLGGLTAGDYDAWLARCDSAGNRIWICQFGTASGDGIYALAPFVAGGVYAAGVTVGSLGGPNAGAGDAWLAIYGCWANCDNSTTAPILNVGDFACFLNMFAAGDPYANCDGSTTPPVLNVLDFACFLNKFAAGCQ